MKSKLMRKLYKHQRGWEEVEERAISWQKQQACGIPDMQKI